MDRYINGHMLLRGLHLLIIPVLLVSAFGLTLGYAARSTEPSKLLQFTAVGHILGFEAKGVYVASADHMLRVEIAGTHGVMPVADRMPSENGQPLPLGKVAYQNLWPGISLSYQV